MELEVGDRAVAHDDAALAGRAVAARFDRDLAVAGRELLHLGDRRDELDALVPEREEARDDALGQRALERLVDGLERARRRRARTLRLERAEQAVFDALLAVAQIDQDVLDAAQVEFGVRPGELLHPARDPGELVGRAETLLERLDALDEPPEQREPSTREEREHEEQPGNRVGGHRSGERSGLERPARARGGRTHALAPRATPPSLLRVNDPAASTPTPATEPEGGARVARRVLAGVLLGLLAYAALALWADVASVRRALADLPLAVVPAAVLLSFLNYGVRFVRWELYRSALGIRLDRATSFLVHLSGLALTVSPGKLGEAFKAWLIRRVDGTPVATSAPIVVAERFTDLLGFLVLIAVGGLATAPDKAWIFWATLALCAVLLVFVAWRPANELALRVARALPVVKRFAPKVEEALASTRVLLAPKRLVVPTLLATFGWSLECTGFWLVASALAPEPVPFLFAVYVFALAAVAGAVAIVFPGGLGITEASMTALTAQRYMAGGLARELAQSRATAATLVIRLCTLWFAVLLGVVALMLFERRMRARQRATP